MIPSLDYTHILKLDIDNPSKYDEDKLMEKIRQVNYPALTDGVSDDGR